MTIHSKRLVVTLVLAALAVVATAGFIAWRLRRTVETLTRPQEKVVDLSAVTTRIRDLNRLETASMHIVHVSTVTQQYKLVPNSIGGDELTLFAGGDVIAGVDLSQLKTTDVWRQPDGKVVVRLPPPQVLVTRIDNNETRVIARKTGLLRRSDPGLEGRARLYAACSIRSEAVRKGILTLAEKNAQARIAELLHAAGAERIEFVDATNVRRTL
jgi:hypothetical protein